MHGVQGKGQRNTAGLSCLKDKVSSDSGLILYSAKRDRKGTKRHRTIDKAA